MNGMGLRRDCVWFYALDEGEGQAKADSRGGGALVAYGTVGVGEGPGGRVAADLGMAAGHFETDDAEALLFGERWTLSFFLYHGGGSYDGVVGKRRSSGALAGSELVVLVDEGTLVVRLINAANTNMTFFSTGMSVSPLQWEHYAITFDRSGGTGNGMLRCYRNSNEEYTASLTAAQRPRVPSVSTLKRLTVGSEYDSVGRLGGLVALVAGWSRVLDADEIDRLNNSGRGLSWRQFGRVGPAASRSRAVSRRTDPQETA